MDLFDLAHRRGIVEVSLREGGRGGAHLGLLLSVCCKGAVVNLYFVRRHGADVRSVCLSMVEQE